MTGGLLALLLRGPLAGQLLRYSKLLLVSATAITAMLIWYHVKSMRTPDAVLVANPLATIGLSVIAFFGACLLLELVRPASTLARLLCWTPLRRLGQVSYGFYVFHDIPHALYAQLAVALGGYTIWRTAAIGMAGTLLLSFGSYRFFESPLLALKNRFAEPRTTAKSVHV